MYHHMVGWIIKNIYKDWWFQVSYIKWGMGLYVYIDHTLPAVGVTVGPLCFDLYRETCLCYRENI